MKTLVRVLAALALALMFSLRGRARTGDDSTRAQMLRLAVTHPWLIIGAITAGIVVLALLVVISGVVPINASSGHWAITSALLDFAKVRSVSTHSWGIDTPPLDDERMILKGGGHYETACLACHGAPGRTIPPVMMAMTPGPPDLTEQVGRWKPEELFAIVKHGIKLTGMPAWPDQQRDDEVWAMVAFLRRLPSLDATAYRRLAYGDTPSSPSRETTSDGSVPAAVRTLCSRCHGIDGTGRGPGAFPSLAGQRATYLYESLRAFRERRRFSAIMGEIAARVSDAEMHEIAAYYERQPPRAAARAADESSIARGRHIATNGRADREIPACIECHGPTALPKNDAYPRLTGQHADYLMAQLDLLQGRRRGGTRNINLMHAFVDRLRKEEIRDAAHYYAATAAPGAPPVR
jgi:cytochrome c553